MVEKRLGAVPVAAGFLRWLDVGGIVGEVCPGGASAHVTHGQVVEALVAGRLASPAPLVRVWDWARTWAVEEVFGITPDLLNDDRLARALDAIAPELEVVAGTAGARAVTGFGIDVSRLHWDMAGMSAQGAFPAAGQDERYPLIACSGHPEDRRVDLKQVQTGLAVTAGGGIPVHARAFGGAGASQAVGAVNGLKAMAGTPGFLMAAGSRLVSCSSITALPGTGAEFIAPVPAAQIKDAFCAALDRERAEPADWVPERDERKPQAERETCRVLEDTHTLAGRRRSDPPLTVRRILAHSTAVAAGQQAARAKRLARAAADLGKLTAAAGGRHCRTREKTAARIGVITAKRRVNSCLRWQTTADGHGTPGPAWHFDQDAPNAGAAAGGWHALITSLPPGKAGPARVLIHYKGQGTA
ncbi:DUF4277 domain-containing protein [Streptomyces sp. NPDC127051]|uniref:IS1634 family transposase n=1 Tax=Streptomyces sp. NPDC127051 TaxID=3347119 RepID=UPI00364B139F